MLRIYAHGLNSVPDTNSKIPNNSVNYKVLSTAVSSIKKILPGIEPPANYHLLASSGFRNLTSVVTSPGVATSALKYVTPDSLCSSLRSF